MRLEHLGWDPSWAQRFAEHKAPAFPARIVNEERGGLYRALGEDGERRVRLTGKAARRAALDIALRPAVGDWVALAARHDDADPKILAVLPRKTVLIRLAAGTARAPQVLASNMDTVLVVSSLNRDFNARRIERALALAYESGAQPIVVLSKSDLAAERGLEVSSFSVPVLRVSVVTGDGLLDLRSLLATGRTAVLMGSSGVGKSSLINALLGTVELPVGAIREDDDRGRHTTTSRHLLQLPGGGMVIDTPGLRELQLWGHGAGVASTFGDLTETATECRFRDCKHRNEPGCAVRQAIVGGQLDSEQLDHHRKLEAELHYSASRDDVQLSLARKRYAKRMCKTVRDSKTWKGNR
jgi:ribosome biogenesis GTPase